MPDSNELIEEILKRFEEQFFANPNLRIEEFEPSIDDADREKLGEANWRKLIEELIFLEIDMRYTGQQPIDRFAYRRRFPDYETVVNEAIARVFQAHQDAGNAPTLGADSSSTERVVIVGGTATVPDHVGHYENVKVIGMGGFGIVCRAEDNRTNQVVALKFPRARGDQHHNEQALSLLIRETTKALKLDHPNIVKTLELETVNNYVFSVQEFVRGSDLKQTMDRDRSLAEKLELVARIADALETSSQLGVFHCDLKPANVLIDENDNPKVTDFGLAFHESEQLDMPKQQIGTPQYMSPQLVNGLIQDVDVRNDIFSLGVILYELLTGRRPFRGHHRDEIFRQIQSKDPTPIRSYCPEVDFKLENICQRCLAKKARDRYAVARDLAADLRDWIRQHEQNSAESQEREKEIVEKPTEFVSHGLRPFGPKDSAFFLELLPGQRNRDGIPLSIEFWKERLESDADPDSPLKVGFIFGPSGSGKSSFVRAGLLPQLDRQRIEPIYVESTVNDTGLRLIRALRNRFPTIPNDISLPEILAGLTRGMWTDESEQRKFLIVLDQFEQRLSVNDDYAQSQLAQALQHCDGKKLHCLITCRDDFWLAASRFADALEIDIREGENSQGIDLFDPEHARKVLIRYGQAFGKLPQNELDFSPDQTEFLDLTVQQLSQAGYIICVRLTLFAELFKSRPWTTSELENVGGVQGVGETFLENQFGPESPNVKLRQQRKRVQALLQALLPDARQDIRGSMKSVPELMKAAELENHPKLFDEIIRVLDNEFRLVTRTDPDSTGESSVFEFEGGDDRPVYYQLTHDYLVPSIRSWLHTELRNSRRGRALIRLHELAAQVDTKLKPKYLPSSFEWLFWAFAIRDKVHTPEEQAVYRAGRKRFLRGSGLLVAAVILLGSVIGFLQYERNAEIAFRSVLESETSALSTAISRAEAYRWRLAPRFRRLVDDPDSSERDSRRARLALYAIGEDQSQFIHELLVDPTTSPSLFSAVIDIVRNHRQDDFNKYLHAQSTSQSGESTPIRRNRVLVLHLLCSPELIEPGDLARDVARGLLTEDIYDRNAWIRVIRPVGRSLAPGILREFRDLPTTTHRDDLMTLARAWFEFADPEDFLEQTAANLKRLSLPQLQVLFRLIEENLLTTRFRHVLANRGDPGTDPESSAKMAWIRLRFGLVDPFEQLARRELDDLTKMHLITSEFNAIVPLFVLKSYYDSETRRDNDYFRQTLLYVLAERCLNRVDDDQADWIRAAATEAMIMDRDPSCYAVSELILRRLDPGKEEKLIWANRRKRRQRQLAGEDVGRVYIDGFLLPYSVINIPTRENEIATRQVCIAMYESTNQTIHSGAFVFQPILFSVTLGNFAPHMTPDNSGPKKQKVSNRDSSGKRPC